MPSSRCTVRVDQQCSGSIVPSCHSRAPASRLRHATYLQPRAQGASLHHSHRITLKRARRGVITRAGRSPSPVGDHDDDDLPLGYNTFDDYEEYDEWGVRKPLQSTAPRTSSAAARAERAARAAARDELLAARGGLLSSDVMRAALEQQQAQAREEILRLQRENSPALLAEMLSSQGYDLEEDWKSLEQPRSTTGAVKDKATDVDPGSQTLKRPPTTPKIDAMRRQTAEMRRRRRLFDPDLLSYDSDSSSGSDEDMPGRSLPLGPSSPSGIRDVDMLSQRAQAAANLLQNAGEVVDTVGLDSLKRAIRSQDNAQNRPGEAFGLSMFASDTEDDFGGGAVRRSQQQGRNRRRDDDDDDEMTDKVLGHIEEVYYSAMDVPTLQQKPGNTGRDKPITRSTQAKSTPSASSAPRKPPPVAPAWPDLDNLVDQDEDSLISLLEQMTGPPAPVRLTKPTTPTPPSPPPTIRRAAPPPPLVPPRIPTNTNVDGFVDDLLGGLLGGGPPTPQLTSRPSVFPPRPTTSNTSSSSLQGKARPASAPALQPQSAVDDDDEEAIFERLYAAAQASVATKAVTPPPLTRPPAAHPSSPTATRPAVSGNSHPHTSSSSPSTPAIRTFQRPTSPPPATTSTSKASPLGRPQQDDDDNDDDEFERLYAAAKASAAAKAAAAAAVPPLSSRPAKPTQPAPATTRTPPSRQPPKQPSQPSTAITDAEFERLYAAAKEAATSKKVNHSAPVSPVKPAPAVPPTAPRSSSSSSSSGLKESKIPTAPVKVVAPSPPLSMPSARQSPPLSRLEPVSINPARALSPKPQRPQPSQPVSINPARALSPKPQRPQPSQPVSINPARALSPKPQRPQPSQPHHQPHQRRPSYSSPQQARKNGGASPQPPRPPSRNSSPPPQRQQQRRSMPQAAPTTTSTARPTTPTAARTGSPVSTRAKTAAQAAAQVNAQPNQPNRLVDTPQPRVSSPLPLRMGPSAQQPLRAPSPPAPHLSKPSGAVKASAPPLISTASTNKQTTAPPPPPRSTKPAKPTTTTVRTLKPSIPAPPAASTTPPQPTTTTTTTFEDSHSTQGLNTITISDPFALTLGRSTPRVMALQVLPLQEPTASTATTSTASTDTMNMQYRIVAPSRLNGDMLSHTEHLTGTTARPPVQRHRRKLLVPDEETHHQGQALVSPASALELEQGPQQLHSVHSNKASDRNLSMATLDTSGTGTLDVTDRGVGAVSRSGWGDASHDDAFPGEDTVGQGWSQGQSQRQGQGYGQRTTRTSSVRVLSNRSRHREGSPREREQGWEGEGQQQGWKNEVSSRPRVALREHEQHEREEEVGRQLSVSGLDTLPRWRTDDWVQGVGENVEGGAEGERMESISRYGHYEERDVHERDVRLRLEHLMAEGQILPSIPVALVVQGTAGFVDMEPGWGGDERMGYNKFGLDDRVASLRQALGMQVLRGVPAMWLKECVDGIESRIEKERRFSVQPGDRYKPMQMLDPDVEGGSARMKRLNADLRVVLLCPMLERLGINSGWLCVRPANLSMNTLHAIIAGLTGEAKGGHTCYMAFEPVRPDNTLWPLTTNQTNSTAYEVDVGPLQALTHTPSSPSSSAAADLQGRSGGRGQHGMEQSVEQGLEEKSLHQQVYEVIQSSVGHKVTGRVVAASQWGAWVQFEVEVDHLNTPGDGGDDDDVGGRVPVLGFLRSSRCGRLDRQAMWPIRRIRDVKGETGLQPGDFVEAQILCGLPPRARTCRPEDLEAIWNAQPKFGMYQWSCVGSEARNVPLPPEWQTNPDSIKIQMQNDYLLAPPEGPFTAALLVLCHPYGAWSSTTQAQA